MIFRWDALVSIYVHKLNNGKFMTVYIYLQLQKIKIMNILNLEVKVKRIKIKTVSNGPISFSLRLGRVLSAMSPAFPNKTDSPIQPNVNLIVGCQQHMISNNSRASLVIYEVGSKQNRDIIGMVFVLLKSTQGEQHRYRVQQSNDPNSYVELSFSITNLQLKQTQNRSLASKSSLAQIRQFHRVLSGEEQRTRSEIFQQNGKIKKSRLSPQDKEKQLRSYNLNKIPHLKSQQSPFGDQDEDPSYAILLKKTQSELAKQKQRNSLLINLLAIQQAKNNQAQNFIQKFMSSLEILQQNYQLQDNNISQNGQKSKYNINSKNNSTETNHKIKNDQDTQYTYHSTKHTKLKNMNSHDSHTESRIQLLTKERDELYSISQQLYQKTKKYKMENEKLYRNLKTLQNQLQIVNQQMQQLKHENKELKTKYFELYDKKQRTSHTNIDTLNSNLKQEIELLKNENTEYERKFKQSLKFIEQFKNDALKAHQQIFVKDQQITSLRQQLENIKNSSVNRQQSRQFSSSQNQLDEKQIIRSANESFKLMTSLLIKNNLQRNQILQLLSQKKIQSQSMDDEKIKFLKDIKDKIEKIYLERQKQNKRTINILQMKKKFMEIVNQINC